MILVPMPILQVLHDYLLTRPMGEVEQLVAALRKCKPAPPPASDQPYDE